MGKHTLNTLLIFLFLLLFFQPSWAEEADFFNQRLLMVKNQLELRGIKDKNVLAAMRKVKRHKYVPKEYRHMAYQDRPLPIREGQTISQPYIVALMTELLKLQSDEKILEIGTGSGYQAAILGEIVKKVITIEIVDSLAESSRNLLNDLGYTNITVIKGDGYKGWPKEAPFDGIIVTAAPDHIPDPLKKQLKIGGRIIIPVGKFFQKLYVLEKTETGFVEKYTLPVRFVPMTGEAERRKK